MSGSDSVGSHSVDLKVTRGAEEIDLTLNYEMVHVMDEGCSTSGKTPGFGALFTILVLFGLRRRSQLQLSRL